MVASEHLEQLVVQRLVRARRERGLSQRALAALLGWPYGTLANYESGRRPLTLAHFVQLAATLEHSPASFLIDSPTAALLHERIGSDERLASQVFYFLSTLDDPLPKPPL